MGLHKIDNSCHLSCPDQRLSVFNWISETVHQRRFSGHGRQLNVDVTDRRDGALHSQFRSPAQVRQALESDSHWSMACSLKATSNQMSPYTKNDDSHWRNLVSSLTQLSSCGVWCLIFLPLVLRGFEFPIIKRKRFKSCVL